MVISSGLYAMDDKGEEAPLLSTPSVQLKKIDEEAESFIKGKLIQISHEIKTKCEKVESWCTKNEIYNLHAIAHERDWLGFIKDYGDPDNLFSGNTPFSPKVCALINEVKGDILFFRGQATISKDHMEKLRREYNVDDDTRYRPSTCCNLL